MFNQAPVQVLALPGSLRTGSYNRRLLEVAGELAPPATELRIYGLESLPLYNRDVEARGNPTPVEDFKAAIAGADALLIATPEYNAGTSGVLKNAIDWASRPPRQSVLADKPVAILGGGGRGGTRRAQAQVRAALAHPGARVLEGPEVAVARISERFDEQGRLVDDSMRESLRALVENLVAEARQDTVPTRSSSAASNLLAAA